MNGTTDATTNATTNAATNAATDAATRRAVGRILARDDLLTLAASADRAVDIVRARQNIARVGVDGRTLFDIALDRQLALAEQHRRWAVRAQAWNHAAVLLRFCERVGQARPAAAGTEHRAYTPDRLHEKALAELEDHDSDLGLDRDMNTGVSSRLHAARNFRLTGRFAEALDLVNVPVSHLYGKGAEIHTADYMYEVGASYIQLGRSAEIRRQLMEVGAYYDTNPRAKGHPNRSRFEFILALTGWDAGDRAEDVGRQLSLAIDRQRAVDERDETGEEKVQELSLLLTMAEHLAGREPSAANIGAAVGLGREALEIANSIRARWRVLARSRAPLAYVFERVYGDLALLADRLSGPDAAELGFRVAVSAKQTGFAVRIRDGQTFNDNPLINDILRRIVEVESSSAGTFADSPEARESNLRGLRDELVDNVSPMLEDTVFPTAVDLPDLLGRIGSRYALDFVELHDTLDDAPRLYRTLIEPGGRLWFDSCASDPEARALVASGRHDGDLARGIAARDLTAEAAPAGPEIDWRRLAKAVLPERLVDDLRTRSTTMRLLISANSWLSVVPWAALKIDDDGTRLVDRAVIAQTPILTCLAKDPPPAVAGRALIRLVGGDEGGVNVDLERRAWDFPGGTDGVPPHECELGPGERPRPYPGRFDAALAERDDWQFVHVASHGAGKGFGQYLDLPEPRHHLHLSAAQALGLKWPTAVLMASCHVGQVVNDNGAEPLSFVMAVLTGGARCVVAGIDRIDDDGTGRVASHIVREIRAGRVSLEDALRNAQLSAIRDGFAENGWALLSAYVR